METSICAVCLGLGLSIVSLVEDCLKSNILGFSFMHEMLRILHLFIQSLEWNDEPTDEQGGTESPPIVTDDVSAQNSERKEDNLVGVEENEWDKLLRVR